MSDVTRQTSRQTAPTCNRMSAQVNVNVQTAGRTTEMQLGCVGAAGRCESVTHLIQEPLPRSCTLSGPSSSGHPRAVQTDCMLPGKGSWQCQCTRKSRLMHLTAAPHAGQGRVHANPCRHLFRCVSLFQMDGSRAEGRTTALSIPRWTAVHARRTVSSSTSHVICAASSAKQQHRPAGGPWFAAS
jgi:hypothetical protein